MWRQEGTEEEKEEEEEDHLLSCSWGRSDMIVDLAGCVGGSKYEVAHSSRFSAATPLQDQ